MKVIIANNNNNNKNSNSSTSCVGYLQSLEGGESGVLSTAASAKKCLSASGQFKTKIKTKQNNTHIYILVYSWGGTVQKGERGVTTLSPKWLLCVYAPASCEFTKQNLCHLL